MSGMKYFDLWLTLPWDTLSSYRSELSSSRVNDRSEGLPCPFSLSPAGLCVIDTRQQAFIDEVLTIPMGDVNDLSQRLYLGPRSALRESHGTDKRKVRLSISIETVCPTRIRWCPSHVGTR